MYNQKSYQAELPGCMLDCTNGAGRSAIQELIVPLCVAGFGVEIQVIQVLPGA